MTKKFHSFFLLIHQYTNFIIIIYLLKSYSKFTVQKEKENKKKVKNTVLSKEQDSKQFWYWARKEKNIKERKKK